MSAETRGRLLGLTRMVVLMTCLVGATVRTAAVPLTPIPGSPFMFYEGGTNANCVCLSPDEKFLFVSNQNSSTVTVLNVAESGELSFGGYYPTYSFENWTTPTGIATNPAGDRLYVTSVYNASVDVHAIDNGALTQIQSAPTNASVSARDGIAYVSRLGGDFLYVSNNGWPNSVSVFPVLSDGTLGEATVVDTGAYGGGYFYAIATLRATTAVGPFLFISNPESGSISVFTIGDDGSLTPHPNSPFSVSNGFTGSIAVSPDVKVLYAAGYSGYITKLTIGADGALSDPVLFHTGYWDDVNTIQVHPTLPYLIASQSWGTSVVDTAALAPTSGSPVPTSGYSAGAMFDAAGARLFRGIPDYGTCVNVMAADPNPWWATAPAVNEQCTGPTSALTLESHAFAKDGRALTVNWTIDGVPVQTDEVPASTDGSPTSQMLSYTGIFTIGWHPVEIRVSDGTTEDVGASFVNIYDSKPPVLNITMDNPMLWPISGAMVKPMTATVEDCDPNVMVEITVYSDEDDADPPTLSPDASGFTLDTLCLRAERNVRGDGRVYLIEIRAWDQSYNWTPTYYTTVVVPLRNDRKSITAVQAQAQAALDYITTTGQLPGPPVTSPFYLIGDGPVIGRKP